MIDEKNFYKAELHHDNESIKLKGPDLQDQVIHTHQNSALYRKNSYDGAPRQRSWSAILTILSGNLFDIFFIPYTSLRYIMTSSASFQIKPRVFDFKNHNHFENCLNNFSEARTTHF